MKILVTGSYGQLGNEMQVEARRHKEAECLFTDADTLDICDKDALERRVAEEKPDYIVNCAAYTAVDKAEDDEAAAHKVNVDAVRNIGETAARHGVKVIHVSTDYVFDGNGHLPYTEDMPVAPTNVYGRTKLAGERALLEADSDAIIIRTAWLYSSFGNNFHTPLTLQRQYSPSFAAVGGHRGYTISRMRAYAHGMTSRKPYTRRRASPRATLSR